MKFGYTWGSILMVVASSVTGDILVSLAMKQVGDLGHVYRERGLWFTLKSVLGSGTLWSGVCFMGLAFFSLLFALSWADISLVAPACAALTSIGNALTAKVFLHENVDRRRWIAALLVAGGVVLVAG